MKGCPNAIRPRGTMARMRLGLAALGAMLGATSAAASIPPESTQPGWLMRDRKYKSSQNDEAQREDQEGERQTSVAASTSLASIVIFASVASHAGGNGSASDADDKVAPIAALSTVARQ